MLTVRNFLLAALWLLGASVLVAITTLMPSYQECVANAQQYQSKNPSDYTQEMLTRSSVFLECGRVFLEKNDGVLTAIATLAIAAFTLTLWRATAGLRHSTEKLWKAGERQIEIAIQSASAAQKSAEVAEKTLVASQRPWVNLNVEIAGPLFFDSNGAGIKLKITTKNTGTTPATNILAHPMIFCREQNPFQAREIIERRSATFGTGGGMGHALFKGNIFQEFNMPSMGANEYAGERWISPFVLVAVKYKSPLGDETYMTAKLYHLLQLNPAQPGQAIGILPGVDVPASVLELKIAGSHAI